MNYDEQFKCVLTNWMVTIKLCDVLMTGCIYSLQITGLILTYCDIVLCNEIAYHMVSLTRA